jgi:hypothetical protein
VVAMSVLPIERDTIIIGTNDAGKTFHSESEELNEKLKIIGAINNLRSHTCIGKRFLYHGYNFTILTMKL